MDHGELIARYGYLAVLLGTLLEGETVVLLAGFAAQRGHLNPVAVAACACAGALCSDQFFFHLGRAYGTAWLERRPAWQQRLARVRHLADQHRIKLALTFRFLYGLRTVAPIALGLSGLTRPRFLALNVASVVLWSATITGLGYTLGRTLEPLLGDLQRYELGLLSVLAVAGLLVWLFRRRRARNSLPA